MKLTRRLRRVMALTILIGATLSGLALHAPADAVGVDATCVLALDKTDPATINVAFPDQAADYYTLSFVPVPGLRLRITGQYPHARYISYNVYDPALRPFGVLSDIHLAPDPGSHNPFLPGARRTVRHRSYTAFVEFGDKPAHPAPNTLYVATGQNGAPNPVASLIYRIYIHDKGTTPSGNVPIPTVTVEQSGSGDPVSPSVCGAVNKPSTTTINDLVANSNGVSQLDPVQPFGQPVPRFEKFVNLPTSVSDFFLDNPYAESIRPLLDPVGANGGNGGFLSNLDNAYVTTAVNRAYGEVIMVRFKAPTTPHTRQGQRRMQAHKQLRYWSICENEFFSQHFIACRTDDQVVVGAHRMVTLVMSTPAQRPAKALRRCGVNWIPWGPDAEGVLIYRHMLPDPSFAQSIQNATVGHEATTMHRYLPRAKYFPTPHAFDQSGATTC